MPIGFLVFSNIIAPTVSGLFLIMCFMYFIVVLPSSALPYRNFMIFLAAFALFSLGRPLQLLVGPFPLPLIIVNIRVFILCAVIAPAIASAADIFSNNKTTRLSPIAVVLGILLGITYVVFNTLGTQESYILFRLGSLVARDNLTPSLTAPFFGREMTIIVQFLTGTMLLVVSFSRLLRLRPTKGLRNLIAEKNFLINVGILLFASAFIAGSLARQWWVYYAVSILTSLLFGAAVVIDAREVHRHYQKLVPFIKEDILHAVPFSESSKTKLIELLDCLGKETNLDTFVVARLDGEVETDITLDAMSKSLDRTLGKAHYLALPLSDRRIGVVLHSPEEWKDDRKSLLLHVLEEVKDDVVESLGHSMTLGVGKACSRIEDLHVSYHEALQAQEYAAGFEGSTIIHVDDVAVSDRQTVRYPAKEKERLLSSIRLGDGNESAKALENFITALRPFLENHPDQLSIRLYELIGSMVDAAQLGGGDEETLDKLASRFVGNVDLIKDFGDAEDWLRRGVTDIVGGVTFRRTSRMSALMARATSYIRANYAEALSYKDVARELDISPSYFNTLFKKELDSTFVDYLTSVRIEEAKKLLVSSDLKITEIADKVGCNSSNYFSSLFKKITGLSAKEYRIQHPRTHKTGPPKLQTIQV